jgi:hypothetical protein
MKIKISELRKVVNEVLSEMYGPETVRSPDTEKVIDPDTLAAYADSEPRTEKNPQTQRSSGVNTVRDDSEEDDTTLSDFMNDLDRQDIENAPTLSMRALGLRNQSAPDTEIEPVPKTQRSPG